MSTSNQLHSKSNILHTTESGTTLIDVPLKRDVLHSLKYNVPISSPPKYPYVLAEPKKLGSTLAQTEELHKLHTRWKDVLENALLDMKNAIGESGRWCCERPETGEESLELIDFNFGDWAWNLESMRSMGCFQNTSVLELSSIQSFLIMLIFSIPGDFTENVFDIDSIYSRVVANNSSTGTTLSISIPGRNQQYSRYYIPAHSAFLLARFQPTIGHMNIYASSVNGFDLLILDPPWPNKSASRGSKYRTIDVFDLYQLRIGHWLREGGLVAVWCTTKTKFNNFTKEKLFPAWGVDLIAEWVWLKASYGEPVFNLDSLNRKPYEPIIIGRKRLDLPRRNRKRNKAESKDIDHVSFLPDRKVLIGVPEKHSVKPNLIELLGDFISPNAVIGEVFARNLTSGCFSWGDQVLQHQSVRE
ncbi:Methyltransferase-like protein 4 [Neolecta irregularis DAH-3]|uniref:Methyltransferase-like protein 4 n=1 Tax=Neolecta irregularis (strain DAH-3) TaxID=1198029 RepID=A0A1U7LK59_NEOID|nr:Methyltransferase-like protein 4 [Neolecta irregularis DAH-3]|eukprot:OLL23045.1 Methyltransferase-like protein 4 [Neolecta irregularis DAH-3]